MLRKKYNERGLTLVETIVIVALFTIVMGAISQSIFSFYQLNSYTIAQSYQVSHARKGMEQMVRDIREMTFSDDGAFPLVIMEKYRIGFFSDIDRDQSVEYIEYRLSTTTTNLTKKIFNATGSPPVYNTGGAPDSTLIMSEYVQNSIQNVPIFMYYDGNGVLATTTATMSDIRYVKLNVVINIDPIRDPGEFMLRSSTSLRNLKNTL